MTSAQSMYNNPSGSHYILSQMYIDRIIRAFNSLPLGCPTSPRKLADTAWIDIAREALGEWNCGVGEKQTKSTKRARNFV